MLSLIKVYIFLEGKTKPIDDSKNVKSNEMVLLEKQFYNYSTFKKLSRRFRFLVLLCNIEFLDLAMMSVV